MSRVVRIVAILGLCAGAAGGAAGCVPSRKAAPPMPQKGNAMLHVREARGPGLWCPLTASIVRAAPQSRKWFARLHLCDLCACCCPAGTYAYSAPDRQSSPFHPNRFTCRAGSVRVEQRESPILAILPQLYHFLPL